MIQHLTVCNVGPHGRRSFDFGRGLTAVLGRNGVGKSFILGAIAALLTNDFSAVAGVGNNRLINLASGDDEPSYIEGVFEIRGVTLRIRRGFRRAKSSLVITGEEELTKATEIQTRLTDFFGVEPGVLAASIFVQQGQLHAVVTMRPADRINLLQSISGLDRCSRIESALTKRAARELAAAEALSTTGTETEDLAATVLRIEALRAEQTVLQSKRIDEEQRAEWQALVDQAARAAEMNAAARRTAAARDAAEGEYKQASAALANAKAAFDKAVAAVDRISSIGGETAAEQMQALQVQEAKAAKYASAVKAYSAVADLPIGAVVDEESPSSRLRQEELAYAALVGASAETATMLESLQDIGTATCPTCGTELKDVPKRVAELRAKLADLRPRQVAQRAVRDAAAEELRKARAHNAAVAAAVARLDKARAVLAAAEVVEPVDTEEVARLSLLAANWTTAVNQKASCELAWTRADAAAASALRNWTTAKATAASTHTQPAPAAELVSAAKAGLAADAATALALSKVAGQIQESAQTLAARRKAVAEAVKRKSQAAGYKRRADLLAEVGTAFHRTEIPTRVMRRRQAALAGRINYWLELFDTGFTATLTDELGFDVQKADGQVHPAAQLSGAQRDVLGLAFWLSIPSVVPILLLDEPTSQLDAANRRRLGQVFTKLAGAAEDRQVIVTTHADDLLTTFDQRFVLE